MTDNVDNETTTIEKEIELTERECKVLDLAELMTECATEEDLIHNYYDFQLYYYNSLTDEELDAELLWVYEIIDDDDDNDNEEAPPTIH